MEEALTVGRTLQSRVFPALTLIVTMTDKPAPPAVGMSAISPNSKKSIVIPYPDWPQVVEAVESLRQELEIV